MVASIGRNICSGFLDTDFCNTRDGNACGWTILTGSVLIGYALFKYLRPKTPRSTNTLVSRTITPEGPPLPKILDKVGRKSALGIAFKAIEDGGYPISAKNRLRWKDNFIKVIGGLPTSQLTFPVINGISFSDLTQPIMWGVDNIGRYFFSIRLSCSLNTDPPAKEPQMENFDSAVYFEKKANSPNEMGTYCSSLGGYKDFALKDNFKRFQKLIEGQSLKSQPLWIPLKANIYFKMLK